MGSGPCFNIEISCDWDYAQEWLEKNDDYFTEKGIDVRGFVKEEGADLEVRFKGFTFEMRWVSDYDNEYFPATSEGLVIRLGIYYSEDMNELTPKLIALGELYDLIKRKTKKKTAYYCCTYTL
jgi:hypothetical protein